MLHVAVDAVMYQEILYIVNTDNRLDGNIVLVKGSKQTYDADIIITRDGIEFPFSWNAHKAPFLFTEPLPNYPQFVLGVMHFLLGNHKTSQSILEGQALFSFESSVVASIRDQKKISWKTFKRIIQLEEDTPTEVHRTQHNAAITLHFGKVDIKDDRKLKKYYYERAINLAPHGILRAHTAFYYIQFLKEIGESQAIQEVKDSVLNDKSVPNSVKDYFIKTNTLQQRTQAAR